MDRFLAEGFSAYPSCNGGWIVQSGVGWQASPMEDRDQIAVFADFASLLRWLAERHEIEAQAS